MGVSLKQSLEHGNPRWISRRDTPAWATNGESASEKYKTFYRAEEKKRQLAKPTGNQRTVSGEEETSA